MCVAPGALEVVVELWQVAIPMKAIETIEMTSSNIPTISNYRELTLGSGMKGRKLVSADVQCPEELQYAPLNGHFEVALLSGPIAHHFVARQNR